MNEKVTDSKNPGALTAVRRMLIKIALGHDPVNGSMTTISERFEAIRMIDQLPFEKGGGLTDEEPSS